MKTLAVCFVALAMAGCYDTIDATTSGSMTESLEKMSRNIPIEKKEEFDSALVELKKLLPKEADLAAVIHGLSADSLIEKSKELQDEHLKKKREIAKQQMVELEKQIRLGIEQGGYERRDYTITPDMPQAEKRHKLMSKKIYDESLARLKMLETMTPDEFIEAVEGGRF